MSWYKQTINDSDVAKCSEVAFFEALSDKFRKANFSNQRAVFKSTDDSGAVIFYISPEASAVAKDVLSLFKATPCIESPNLDLLIEFKY